MAFVNRFAVFLIFLSEFATADTFVLQKATYFTGKQIIYTQGPPTSDVCNYFLSKITVSEPYLKLSRRRMDLYNAMKAEIFPEAFEARRAQNTLTEHYIGSRDKFRVIETSRTDAKVIFEDVALRSDESGFRGVSFQSFELPAQFVQETPEVKEYEVTPEGLRQFADVIKDDINRFVLAYPFYDLKLWSDVWEKAFTENPKKGYGIAKIVLGIMGSLIKKGYSLEAKDAGKITHPPRLKMKGVVLESIKVTVGQNISIVLLGHQFYFYDLIYEVPKK